MPRRRSSSADSTGGLSTGAGSAIEGNEDGSSVGSSEALRRSNKRLSGDDQQDLVLEVEGRGFSIWLKRSLKALARVAKVRDIIQALCCVFLWISIPFQVSFALPLDDVPSFNALYATSYLIDCCMCGCLISRCVQLYKSLGREGADSGLRYRLAAECVSAFIATPFDAIMWGTAPSFVPYVRFVHMVHVPLMLPGFFSILDRSPIVDFIMSRGEHCTPARAPHHAHARRDRAAVLMWRRGCGSRYTALRTFIYTILFVHTLSCGLWYFSRRTDGVSYPSGYFADHNSSLESASYVRTTYFSLLSFSSVLSEDIAIDRSRGDGTTIEYLVGIAMTLLVNVVFLYVAANWCVAVGSGLVRWRGSCGEAFSELCSHAQSRARLMRGAPPAFARSTSIVLHSFQKLEDYRNKLGAIDTYLRRNRVPKQLSRLVKNHFRTSFTQNKYAPFCPTKTSRPTMPPHSSD
jgi:hypothetical protein